MPMWLLLFNDLIKPVSQVHRSPISEKLFNAMMSGQHYVKRVEDETKWPKVRRRHFQMHFLEWKCMDFDFNIQLNFVPNGLINNSPSLIQILAWCRLGDKPLSEPMVVSLLTHMCVTRSQGVSNYRYTCISCFASHYRRNYSYFSRRGINGPTPLPMLGTGYQFFTKVRS